MMLSGLPIPASTLRHHVVHVVGLGSEKQMSRIHTGRVVTTMKRTHTLRHGAIVQFPTNMRGLDLPKTAIDFTANARMPVASRVGSAKPQPAIVGAALIDFLPEAFSKRAQAVVTMTESYRAAVDVPLAGSCLLCYRRESTASALAVAVRGVIKLKFELVRVWGILRLHQKLILSGVKPGAFHDAARRFSFGFPPVLYHKIDMGGNHA